jgi:nitric oxide reductase NorD protein
VSWDEALFKKCFDSWKKFKNRDSLVNEQQKILLVSMRPRLGVMASALCQQHIEIYPIRRGHGYTRVRSLVLPNETNLFLNIELNESLYICRTAFSALVIREFSKGNASHFTQQTWVDVVTGILKNDYPGLLRLLNVLDDKARGLIDSQDWHLLSRGSFPTIEFDDAKEDETLAITLESKKNVASADLVNPRASLAKVKRLNTNDTNPAVHVFEKVLTAEDYQGGKRQIDPDSDSSDMSGALAELNMDQVVRAAGETGSNYSGGLFLDEDTTEPTNRQPTSDSSHIFFYPEWSRRKHKFLPNWCTVFERNEKVSKNSTASIANAVSKKEVKRLKRKLEIIVNKPIWVRNQQDGTDLDLEAIVRFKTDLKAGSAVGKNLFIDRKRVEHDIGVLILADISLSTDAWIANKRVFDIIQQSLTILSEALCDFPATVSLAAFYSNTRKDCTYLKMKDFAEPWCLVPEQIAALAPQGYTRMGPAIRHATHSLGKVKTRRKLLLIISDSKPTDYDAYEGLHGESDVAHALLEARSLGIAVKGLAVAAPNTGHVTRIYGSGGFERFTDARGLSERIIRAFTVALKVN